MKNLISILLIILIECTSVFGQWDYPVMLTKEYDENRKEYKIYATNHTFSSKVVEFTFQNATNIQCLDGITSFKKTVKPGAKQQFTKVKARDEDAYFNFSYTYKYSDGCVRTKPDADYPYLIPVADGKETLITELTFLGNQYSSQANPKDWYAVAFQTNPGDTIFASRAGIVTDVSLGEGSKNSQNVTFDRNINQLIIEHNDCTYADYKIFKENKIFVKPGDKVIPGQAIGISAGENYTNGSHFRFDVRYRFPQEYDDYTHYWAYVPVLFWVNGIARKVDFNNKYTSEHSAEIITKEMSRRVKKRFMKGNGN